MIDTYDELVQAVAQEVYTAKVFDEDADDIAKKIVAIFEKHLKDRARFFEVQAEKTEKLPHGHNATLIYRSGVAALSGVFAHLRIGDNNG